MRAGLPGDSILVLWARPMQAPSIAKTFPPSRRVHSNFKPMSEDLAREGPRGPLAPPGLSRRSWSFFFSCTQGSWSFAMCERPAAPAISHLAHTCPAVASRGLASVTGTTQTHRFLYDTGRCPWTSRQLSSDGSWLIPHSQPDEMFSPRPAHSHPSGRESLPKVPILASEFPRFSTVST